jgi:hypothetical protein
MNLTLWIIAGLLAVAFFVGGVSKLFVPKDKLAALPAGGWVRDFSPGAVKALGIVDIVAAIGLVLPAALDVVPVLVPLAALGVVLLMIGAVITRVHSHLARTIAPDLAYLVLAGLVAWGRFGPAPFSG